MAVWTNSLTRFSTNNFSWTKILSKTKKTQKKFQQRVQEDDFDKCEFDFSRKAIQTRFFEEIQGTPEKVVNLIEIIGEEQLIKSLQRNTDRTNGKRQMKIERKPKQPSSKCTSIIKV
jgi:hypothetical protein